MELALPNYFVSDKKFQLHVLIPNIVRYSCRYGFLFLFVFVWGFFPDSNSLLLRLRTLSLVVKLCR
jgi:uncharacterized membrane protein